MINYSQNFYEGYLLKRSSKDPNLWRRRWCILDEDKIWYTKAKHRRAQGKVAYISLVSNQVTENPVSEADVTNVPVCLSSNLMGIIVVTVYFV